MLFFSFGVFFFPYFFFGFMVPCWKFQDWILFIWIHWALWFCCSVTQLCLTLWNPMDCSMPGFPALYCLPEFAQTHVYWVNDAIQPFQLNNKALTLEPKLRISDRWFVLVKYRSFQSPLLWVCIILFTRELLSSFGE